MNLDEYQRAWKADSDQMKVIIDRDALSQEVQHSRDEFQSVIFRRDVREAGGALLMIPIWLVMGFVMSPPWSWYLTILALLWVAGFILVDRQLHPQRLSGPGESLLFYVKESLVQVEHQIWLLRNVFWWYLLPFCLTIIAFFLHVAWQTSEGWFGFAFMAGLGSVFLFVIYRGVYRLNQTAVQTRLEPRRHDLQKLVESLEQEAADEESGDIMELVSALSDPEQHGFSNSSWATNWNQIIPSWRKALTIILPTIGGALCGLFSGMVLQLSELGPTLFQTVIGAVIPFEITLGWALWRHYTERRKETESRRDEPSTTALNAETELVDSELAKSDQVDAAPSLLPRAPAISIVFLTLFLGIMALVAIYSFESHRRQQPAVSNYANLTEPEFHNVSGFANDDIAKIDNWLQLQVDQAMYPSLSIAVVQNGEITYARALGFADVDDGKKATIQAQYHVASVTKVFTASIAAMLHEKGVIDLDAPAKKYLPDDVSISTTPELGAKITIRQLASHTSGLPRGVPGRVQSVDGWYDLEPERLYAHLASTKLESEPGTEELYSNLAFGLLGHVLERAANKSLDQQLQDMICIPLKLESTEFQDDGDIRPVTGYDDSGSYRERTHSFQERLAGSGGLVSSAEDLAKFLASQMETGAFSPETLDELHSRTRLSDGKVTGTALGWSLGWNTFLGPIVEKNGGRGNCSAWIGFSIEHKTGVVAITNCGGPDVDRIGEWLLERSVPAAHKPVTKYGHARVAPFTGVRWQNDRPIVRVEDKWSPLLAINGIAIERIMEFADAEYGEKARKRFSEDIVRLLSKMGHDPDWKIRLRLDTQNGNDRELEVLMTSKNRDRVWDYNRAHAR